MAEISSFQLETTSTLKPHIAVFLNLAPDHLDRYRSFDEYVTAKIERINRHFDHVIDVNVVMTVEKLDQHIEANVHLSGKDIHVAVHDGDMYAAIDGLVDKLDRQVIRHKERFQVSRHKPGIKRITQA